VFTQIAAALVLAVPATSPTATPTSALYAQIQQQEGHFHEGDLGRKYLLIEQNLKCDCGCNLDVHSCQFQMQCGTSPDWSQRVRRELEAGRTVDAIEAGFVADFGPTVLMSPPAEGFNLVGYLLPALAMVTAAMMVGLVVRGGSRHGTVELAASREVSDEEAERLRAAMKRLDESESPDW
jgi:cytochrome c-type biogenesis protein CcmH/NrfF